MENINKIIDILKKHETPNIDGVMEFVHRKSYKYVAKEILKQLELTAVSHRRELLIDCVRTCLKDKDSITVEQQVDNYIQNKSINCG